MTVHVGHESDSVSDLEVPVRAKQDRLTSELETAYDFIACGPVSSSGRRSTSLMRLGAPAAISVGR